MPQSNFTCRLDSELKKAFIKAAKANDRSASVLIRDFMRDYIRNFGNSQKKESSFSADH